MNKGIIIKRAYDGAVLYEAPGAVTTKEAVEAAVFDNADLINANLINADLSGARLFNARLDGAILVNAIFFNARLDGARLNGARLDGASLDGARLVDASLDNASLVDARLNEDTQLPTGERWSEYLRETLPALLTAGGRELGEVATEEHWSCHDWANCPMHAAFGAEGISDVPILLRPRAEQFIQLFDARLIPLDAVSRIEEKS